VSRGGDAHSSAGTARPHSSAGAPSAEAARDDGASRPGRVFLVGAGPGDPGLLTARALQLIAEADVILYDRLIPASALQGARSDAELVFVGKQGGGVSVPPPPVSVPQEKTQALMIERAKAGRSVLRLKGGDPFVFGRGGEEALALRTQGIPFEVVPGVTAGVAAAACAGIPVTHRGLSTAVALITGATERQTELDWPALAAFPGTLVFYMGLSALPRIAAGLIAGGRRSSEPAAVVERGTLPQQRVVEGTLLDIAERARAERLEAPAVTVVGPVAALAAQLRWREPAPLSGRTVAVTRARAQASGLAQKLRELGAEVVEAPAIRISPLPGPPLDPSPYDLICLTSANGVRLLFERLRAGGRDARALAGIRIAAIGPGTAAALAEHGIAADVVPPRFLAEALAEALEQVPVERALIARAAEARDVLPNALRARGAEVDVLPLYETVPQPLSQQTLAAARSADYVTFTSSSTVRHFLAAANDSADVRGGGAEEEGQPLFSASTRLVSIGPVTSATLREHGLDPHVEARQHDVEGLIEALLRDADGARR
jgi:uroporphyrinogen III methyltransferase / synthase